MKDWRALACDVENYASESSKKISNITIFLANNKNQGLIDSTLDMGILRTMAYFSRRYRNKKVTAVSS